MRQPSLALCQREKLFSIYVPNVYMLSMVYARECIPVNTAQSCLFTFLWELLIILFCVTSLEVLLQCGSMTVVTKYVNVGFLWW